MVHTITDRLAISVPVIVDFQGTLSRGVTQDLGPTCLSFVTDTPSPVGTSLSVLFHFGRSVAYMPLAGRVTAVTEDADISPAQFRIEGGGRITQHDAVVRIAGIGPVEMAEESLVAEDDILPADLGAEPIDTGDVPDQHIAGANA